MQDIHGKTIKSFHDDSDDDEDEAIDDRSANAVHNQCVVNVVPILPPAGCSILKLEFATYKPGERTAIDLCVCVVRNHNNTLVIYIFLSKLL